MAKGVYKEHYDNTQLLECTDATGKKPGVYFVCSRGRNAGKSYSFSRTLIERFLDTGEKFALITRYRKGLGGLGDGIMGVYIRDKHPLMTIEEIIKMKGVYSEIYLCYVNKEGKSVKNLAGYGLAIAAAGDIKTYSSTFSDVWAMFFDEFQPDNGRYLKDEVRQLIMIQTSLARGVGQKVKDLPIFMCSNTINITNPYFVYTGLIKHIQADTRLYKGDGYVYERCVVEGLAQKLESTGVARAFRGLDYLNYSNDNSWLVSDNGIICKPKNWGRATYIATLSNGDLRVGVRKYPEVGLLYLSKKIDKTCTQVYNVSLNGMLNIPLIKSSFIFELIRTYFNAGQLRVSDGVVKDLVLDFFC